MKAKCWCPAGGCHLERPLRRETSCLLVYKGAEVWTLDQIAWVWMSHLSLNSWMIFGKSLHLHEPSFFTWKVRIRTGAPLKGRMKSVCVPSHSVISNPLRRCVLWPARLLCPWGFPGKNTGVDCHVLLQGIFLTQGLNYCLLCLLHWWVGSLPLAPPKPRCRTAWRVHVLVSASPLEQFLAHGK